MSEYANTPLKDLFEEAIRLCDNEDRLSEEELCSRLKSILEARPELVRETDEFGSTLLHDAARKRSVEFCKLIVGRGATLVKTREEEFGFLPFDEACDCLNADTVKYLYHLYPESINISNGNISPLHLLLLRNHVELLRYLFKYDQGVVSTPDPGGSLLLHYAIELSRESVTIKLVYDCYPEALYHQNTLDIARHNHLNDVVSFFEIQREFVRQSEEQEGQLCIHRALQNADVSLGTIKLIIKKNPASISFADNQGLTPLHIACQVGNVEAVEYLAATSEGCLMVRDERGNLPIHISCLEGKWNVVRYLSATFGYKNSDGKLPIELLLFEGAGCDRDSIEYVDAFHSLLHSNPVEALGRLVGSTGAIDE